MALLDVDRLEVTYASNRAEVSAAREVSFSVDPGELLALVGESGSGKSTIGQAVVGVLPPSARTSGSIVFDGEELVGSTAKELRGRRRHGIALMPQNGLNALNPVLRIEGQFHDVLRSHQSIDRRRSRARAAELLDEVGLDESVLRRYPHELSGGMRQRACLAIVLALEPRLIVFDEPTTALDVLTQKRVIDTVVQLQRQEGFAGILISHDLGFALEHTSRALIMYAGRIVEELPSASVLDEARHPYTKALIACYGDPRDDEVVLSGIPGDPPDLARGVEHSCLFAPRCANVRPECLAGRPVLRAKGNGRVACFVAEAADERETKVV